MPAYHNAELGFWALSRHADVVAAHLDPETYSSAHGVTIESTDTGQPFLITKDAPEHTWHRRTVSRVFTPRRVGDLEPFIRHTATELLDRHLGASGFDVITDFSFRLPVAVIGALLDIPPDLREEVHEESDLIAARDGKDIAPEAAAQAASALIDIFTRLIATRRTHPGDDVISMLMQTEVETEGGGVRRMDDAELAFRFLELAFAGHETVAKLVANGAVALAWYPDARRRLAQDPG